MEGFVQVTLHDNLVKECEEIDGIYLSHRFGNNLNFYIDKEGNGYWVTVKNLARILDMKLEGISLNDKLIIPWVKNYNLKDKLISLVDVLEFCPQIIEHTKELKKFMADMVNDLSSLDELNILKHSSEYDRIWSVIPNIDGLSFSLGNNMIVYIKSFDNIWVFDPWGKLAEGLNNNG